MSVPRILLVPTHRTSVADAVAAAVTEIVTAQGQKARYHHLGPISPAFAWDRWEGAAFLDLALYGEDELLRLYDVATRGADFSVLSSNRGLLDEREGASWKPVDVARLLDCPIVVLLDCRGWGTGIRALVRGIKAELKDVNLAAVLLTGVEDREHCEVLRQVAAAEELPVVGCLFEAEGPRWDDKAPGAWGLPLEVGFLETVGRQVDVAGLQRLAGQRGFLAVQGWLSDRGVGGPLVLVGGGRGFTPWSRDSIEVLRAAGAQVKRLDLLEDEILPPETAGLVLAGTLWVDTLTEMALNQSLAADIRARMSAGLPTLAMGGGLLYLLERVQDPLGRTHEFAGVLPAEGEILWDLEEPAYVQVSAERDNLLLAQGRTVRGWVTADVEVRGTGAAWDPPLTLRGSTLTGEQAEGAATATLFCTRVFVHLASAPDIAGRFVRQCGLYASSR